MEEQQQTPQQQQQPRKKANSNEKETKRAKLFSKDKENRSFQKEKKPVSASLSISSATFSKDDYSVSVHAWGICLSKIAKMLFFCPIAQGIHTRSVESNIHD